MTSQRPQSIQTGLKKRFIGWQAQQVFRMEVFGQLMRMAIFRLWGTLVGTIH